MAYTDFEIPLLSFPSVVQDCLAACGFYNTYVTLVGVLHPENGNPSTAVRITENIPRMGSVSYDVMIADIVTETGEFWPKKMVGAIKSARTSRMRGE